MVTTQNQLDTQFTAKLGRPTTPYEYELYKNSSLQNIASIDKVYAGYDKANPVGNAMFNGIDPKTLPPPAQPVESTSGGTVADAGASQPQSVPPPPTAQGTIETAADSFPKYTEPTSNPELPAAKAKYSDVQNQIATIDKEMANSFAQKKRQVEASGGIVNEGQLRGMVRAEMAPQIESRRDLVVQQGELGKTYQSLLAADKSAIDNAKFAQATKEKAFNFGLNEQKALAAQSLADKKVVDSEQKHADDVVLNNAKLVQGDKKIEETAKKDAASANKVVKVPQYDQFRQKVGETVMIVNTANTPSKGSAPSIPTTSFGTSVKKSQQTASSGGFSGDGINYSKAALDGLAKSYNQGAKLTDIVGGGNSKVIAALKASIISRAFEMNPNSDPAIQQAQFKAGQQALDTLTKLANTQEGYENKAKAQTTMMLEGYTDPLSGKKMPAIIDAASNADIQQANKFFQAFKVQTGSTPSMLLSNALVTFTTEYAKIMSGGTGSVSASSDSATEHAMSLINTGMNKGNLKAVLGELTAEMDTSVQGNKDQMARLQGNMSKVGGGDTGKTSEQDFGSWLSQNGL